MTMTRHNWSEVDSRQWYKSAIWLKRRRHQLAVKPMCERCEREGRWTAAVVAHHEPPHANVWHAFVFGKLVSLCTDCHDRGTNFQARSFDRRIGADGWPVDHAHPCYRGLKAR